MVTNGYLELELNKVKFQPHWVRQEGKEWCAVLGLVILMIVMLLSTHFQNISAHIISPDSYNKFE